MFLKFIASIFCITLFASSAFANYVGNDTQNFNPIPSGLDYVTVHGSDTIDEGLLNTGFFINQAENSLPDTYDIFGVKHRSDDTVSFGDMSAAYGVSQWLEMGLSLSYLLHQDSDRNQSGAQFSETGLNEIRAMAKYTFTHRLPWGTAMVVSTNINQSKDNPFSGDGGGPTINVEGVLDRVIGNALVALNLGYRIRDEGKEFPGSVFQPLPDQYIGSLATSYYIPTANLKVISEIYAAKSTKDSDYIDKSDISSELLLGIKYDALQNTALHFGGGTRMGSGLFTPDWRVYAGVNFTFDVLHKTTPVAAVDTKMEIDYIKGYLPADIEALKNTDFDEMAKTHEFRLLTAVPDENAEGTKPPFEIIRLSGFDFDFGSAVIRDEYLPILDKMAKYLGSEPKVLKIRVEGHTDSIGALHRNRKIGQLRANAVKAYLEKTGSMPGVEILPVGYGSDRPIADNGNFQGRRQNRRVEVRILRRLNPIPEKVESNKD